jgi:hypothetical protein
MSMSDIFLFATPIRSIASGSMSVQNIFLDSKGS